MTDTTANGMSRDPVNEPRKDDGRRGFKIF
jgi:hypothetical protein